MSGPHVFEVTAPRFQADVLERSLEVPVLLDFWADWCAPCRTLGPVLEKLAAEYGGGFLLGKVDAEREIELAQAFQVQGIPLCVLLRGGRPVDAFQGALAEADVRQFLQRNAVEPAAPEPEPAAAEDANSPVARLARARQAAAGGDAAAARAALQGFPEEDVHIPEARHLLEGLALLETEADPAGPPAEREFSAAKKAFLAGDLEGAMEALLASVVADKGYREGLARKAMLLCFSVLGEEDERCDAFRRRLATMLY